MKLGLLSAPFPNLSLQQVADWASAEGFERLEVACWPRGGGGRRYAGVCHIDVETLDAAEARRVNDLLAARGLAISALAYYPNALSPRDGEGETARAHLRHVIRAAGLLGVGLVGTFIGRDQWKTADENLALAAQVWPDLVRFAADHGVKIAIENCPMIFSNDEWPGGTNLATSPALWEALWERIPGDNFGLNLDPSHLVLQMIDIPRVVRDYHRRIFHVHAKDLQIDREGLYRHGAFSLGMGWNVPRLPGLGEVDWAAFLGTLYKVGYDGTVSIEHEDRAFEGTEDKVKRGFLLARNTLRPLIV